ncbi:hypothetical protein niasHS_008488 [Heterodera schachtii]|uniref:Uncharacterized protein n=1 Tax=Heterodera schachtii TaxID=97005 RepID=A0ABD2JF96_HETSC
MNENRTTQEQQPVVAVVEPSANRPLMGEVGPPPPPDNPTDTTIPFLPPEAVGGDHTADQNGPPPPPPPEGPMLMINDGDHPADHGPGIIDGLPTDGQNVPPPPPPPTERPMLINDGDHPADHGPLIIDGQPTDGQNGPPPPSPPIGRMLITGPNDKNNGVISNGSTEGLVMAPAPAPMPPPIPPNSRPLDNNDGNHMNSGVDANGLQGHIVDNHPPPVTTMPSSSLEIIDGITEHYNTTKTTTMMMPKHSMNNFAVDFVAQNATSAPHLGNNTFNMTTTNLAPIDNGFAGHGQASWNTTKTALPLIVGENNDYGNYVKIDQAELVWAKQHENNHNLETAWSGVFLGAAIANVLILVFLLIITRGKRGYFGTRMYTINLTIFAIMQIFLLAWAQPNDCFGLAKIASIYTRNFFNKYNAQLMEWSQIVYLSCTTVLIVDCMQRYRGNGAGIGKLRWLLAILILDFIPTVYIFVKGIWFEFVELHPKPLAMYHAVVLVIFVLCATFLKLVVCCVPIIRLCCTRAPEEVVVAADRARAHALREKIMTNRLTASSPMGVPPKPFTLSKLALLLLFVLLTGWTQYTVFSLSMDLHPGGHLNIHEFEKMSKHEGMRKLLQFINKEHLTYTVMNIQQWAALVRPFLEMFFALFLLLIPSIGRKFQIRKIAPGQHDNANGIGNMNNEHLIAAGNFSRPMTASGRLVATAPQMAPIRM